jgi:hypothetical protein
MTKQQIMKKLKFYAEKENWQQFKYKEEILDLFGEFLKHKPTRKDFSSLSWLVMFPEFIYYFTGGK